MSRQQSGSGKHSELHPYASLLHELESLRDELTELEKLSAATLQDVNLVHLASSVNLIHYLGLRRRDIRPLQERLAAVGLSSLGRMESHVLANLNAIINLLSCALGRSCKNIPVIKETGAAQLDINTNNLFGKPPSHRRVRIMVTIPSEVADDYSLIKQMLVHGMDCARINWSSPKSSVNFNSVYHVFLAIHSNDISVISGRIS